MGPAGASAQLGLLVVVAAALLSAGLLPSASARGRGGGAAGVNPQVAGICRGTPFPALCQRAAGRYAYRYHTVDRIAVLNMQVEAFAKRAAQARKRAAAVARGSPPAQAQALSFCDTMYMNTLDTVGAAQRAITFKDKGTAMIMLQLAVQDFHSCDRPFEQSRMRNPMKKLDQELKQMANNCMSLANAL